MLSLLLTRIQGIISCGKNLVLGYISESAYSVWIPEHKRNLTNLEVWSMSQVINIHDMDNVRRSDPLPSAALITNMD